MTSATSSSDRPAPVTPRFVSSPNDRAGLLVAIITGGRPTLKERPTHAYVEGLRAAGVHDVVTVVSDAEVDAYEPDPAAPFSTYSRDWAVDYARSHWMHTTEVDGDTFLGAFPGREWACLEAERRGCWGVLQLDDNIVKLSYARGSLSGFNLVADNGGMGMFADFLTTVALSTNGRMVGANLDAVSPARPVLARAGFPYSLFIERVGAGREHWYGPFEDDITHAFQYGTRYDGATAALMPLLTYKKENKAKSGMRKHYNHTRAVQLQRIFPESAKINVRAKTSNGRGQARVFHTMLAGAIRNPLVVKDPDRFAQLRAHSEVLLDDWFRREQERNREKVLSRARNAGITV